MLITKRTVNELKEIYLRKTFFLKLRHQIVYLQEKILRLIEKNVSIIFLNLTYC